MSVSTAPHTGKGMGGMKTVKEVVLGEKEIGLLKACEDGDLDKVVMGMIETLIGGNSASTFAAFNLGVQVCLG